MIQRRPDIPDLFACRFSVDESSPFRRHLNRLEVEIGREDYRHLKRVELLEEPPREAELCAMEEITDRLLATTQNSYNRRLLQRLGIRVYLDPRRYCVYYRTADRAVHFSAAWRDRTLRSFFGDTPTTDTGWLSGASPLPGFQARFVPDGAGGVLLLRAPDALRRPLPLLTATHGPYDPHTLETAFFFLATGRGGAAIVNLGFSGREPLTDENLEKLKGWGIPLNPSNIDVIFPYADDQGHPYCYKLEEGFGDYVRLLAIPPPELIVDIHGCVGTSPEDGRIIVGLGGFPPYPLPEEFGVVEEDGDAFHLAPSSRLRQGLALLRSLSAEIHLQFCTGPRRGFHLRLAEGLRLRGRSLDPGEEVRSLLPGEERTWLPAENVRWLPGAGGNALQRREARKLRPDALCLHVEIPTAIRRRVALCLKEGRLVSSLESSGL